MFLKVVKIVALTEIIPQFVSVIHCHTFWVLNLFESNFQLSFETIFRGYAQILFHWYGLKVHDLNHVIELLHKEWIYFRKMKIYFQLIFYKFF